MKYYYLLNTLQWDNTDKTKVSYIHKGLDGSQILVITSELLTNFLFMFESSKMFTNHTISTSEMWFGDGSSLQPMELEDILYIMEIDELDEN